MRNFPTNLLSKVSTVRKSKLCLFTGGVMNSFSFSVVCVRVARNDGEVGMETFLISVEKGCKKWTLTADYINVSSGQILLF